MNGERSLYLAMAAQILAALQFLLRRVLIAPYIKKILDPLGRYIILKAEIKDKIYVLVNIYAPNKDKEIVTFLNKLVKTLQNEELDSENYIVIGGDFNCPLSPTIDKKGGTLIHRKSVTSCNVCLQSQLDLVDIWRIKNPDVKTFKWSKKSPRIFLSPGLLANLK